MFRLSLVWELQAGSLVLFTCLYYFHMSLLYPCFLVEQAFPSSFCPYLTLALESAFNDTYKPVHGHQECHCFWPFPWTGNVCMWKRDTHTHVRERHIQGELGNVCLWESETHTHTHTHTHFILAVPIISLVSLFLPSPSPLHRCPPQLLRCQPPPSPGGPEFPCWALSSRSSFLTPLDWVSPSSSAGTLCEHPAHLPWGLWPPALSCLTPQYQVLAWFCHIAWLRDDTEQEDQSCGGEGISLNKLGRLAIFYLLFCYFSMCTLLFKGLLFHIFL